MAVFGGKQGEGAFTEHAVHVQVFMEVLDLVVVSVSCCDNLKQCAGDSIVGRQTWVHWWNRLRFRFYVCDIHVPHDWGQYEQEPVEAVAAGRLGLHTVDHAFVHMPEANERGCAT